MNRREAPSGLHIHRSGNLTFDCNIRFPELLRIQGVQSEISLTVAACGYPRPAVGKEVHRASLQNGRPWLQIVRQPAGYLLRFPELADFLVSADAGEVTCYREATVPLNTIRHLFLDQVLPLVLAHRGRLVLHGSAVSTPAGALAFLGESGRGKSTLTAALCRSGMALLTDDCLLLSEGGDGWDVVPSYPGLRLWPDAQQALFGREVKGRAVSHYTVKRRVDGRGAGLIFAAGTAALRCLFILGASEDAPEADALSVQPLAGSDGFVDLARYSYLLDIEDPAQLSRQFLQLGRLAAQVPIVRLNYRRDLSLLADVCQAVLDLPASAACSGRLRVAESLT